MMQAKASAPDDAGVAWFGWVLIGVFAISPLIGWLAPLAFAPIAALGGLLTLRGLHLPDADRPAGIAILVLVTWALASMVWSPFNPDSFERATAIKLILQAVLYWSLFRAAANTSASTRDRALRILAWGMAALGAVLVIEALTGAALYQALMTAIGDPIRPDLAIRNVARGSFVLAVLAPAAALAGWRAGAGVWPGLVMAAGLVGATLALAADAPVVALAASVIATLMVYYSPVWAPRVLGALAAAFFLGAPGIVWATRKLGWFQQLEASAPDSWAQRMGYWRHAAAWIGDKPIRGWGIDASREFAPGIKLHPHDGALQIWLELGLIGATAAAVFWFVVIASQSGPRRDLGKAVSVATAGAYLVFASVSFGVWQEWWLALGGVAAAACVAIQRQSQA